MSNFMRQSKKVSSEQKFEAVLLNIAGAKTIKEVAEGLGVTDTTISNWKKEFFTAAPKIFEEKKASTERSVSEDRKAVDRLGKEVLLLKKLLEHYRRTRDKRSSKPPGQ